MDAAVSAKYDRLVELLRGMERMVVAFSGGVDSTFLGRAARDAVGERALLVIAESETYPASELAEAERLAGVVGLPHRVIRTRELDNPLYAKNAPDRCFFCKQELFTRLAAVAREHAEAPVVYGAIMDDLGDHRPGMEAARRYGVRAPLVEAELWKAEVRVLSRALGLPTWDKPSFACLSSRFQYGDPITAEKLRRVDAAEAFLRELGFRQLRVRDHDRLARLELPVEEMGRIWEQGRREAIVRRLRELGYHFIALDLQGFRSGSANEVLRWIGKG
jgi:pyridinium-3,5-biscarboxylic acid mononucleotide sulfurtransferase